jgi:hypothetical protein
MQRKTKGTRAMKGRGYNGKGGGLLTPWRKKALKGAAIAGAALLAAAGAAHAGRRYLHDRAALEAMRTGGERVGPAFDPLLEPRY